jgi:hypothetical protein
MRREWGGGGGGVAGPQPMSTAVHMEPKKNFGDLTPYLTYAHVISDVYLMSTVNESFNRKR